MFAATPGAGAGAGAAAGAGTDVGSTGGGGAEGEATGGACGGGGLITVFAGTGVVTGAGAGAGVGDGVTGAFIIPSPGTTVSVLEGPLFITTTATIINTIRDITAETTITIGPLDLELAIYNIKRKKYYKLLGFTEILVEMQEITEEKPGTQKIATGLMQGRIPGVGYYL